jgi:hypothetical protein
MEEKLIETIAELKQDSTAAEFEREEKKIRLDSQDKESWGKASNEQRQQMVKDIINACFSNSIITKKIFVWITKPGRGSFLPWARVTFPNAEANYLFEKFVMDRRVALANLPTREKFFTTQRLVPQSFIPTKNEMLTQAKHKMAQDWELLVSSQLETSRKKWIYAKETTWRLMAVRIQFKMTPRFGVWVEGLDPCHRLCWRALDLEDFDSFFKNYDLGERIPDPETRAKASEDPSYATPRKPFKDEQSMEDKRTRPEVFKSRDEVFAVKPKTPKKLAK